MKDKDIEDFLKKMGMRDDQKPEANQWDRVIQPKSSYLLTGDVGTGKSALAYFIIEQYSQKYELTPAVVGLPKSKKELLPDNFTFLDDMSQIPSIENAIVFIDEADIQLPLDSNKNKEMVVNCLSLPRQRKQIFILAYHFPRLVKGTYLPFFSAFLFKRPPYLIEFASKRGSDELLQMMTKADERFGELPSNEKIEKFTYVVAPRIRWQGMLESPLPSFWSEELSEIWSGTEIESEQPKQKELFHYDPRYGLVATDGKTKITTEMLARKILIEKIDMNPPNRIYIDPFTNTKWVE